MIYWYQQLFYGIILFILIHIFKFYVLGNQDIALTIYKYFKGKNDTD